MPNIAALLKEEISRVARKEIRPTAEAFKKAVASQRSEIAALKRRIHELEAQLKRQARASTKPVSTATRGDGGSADEEASGLRFRAAGMAANRKRLGLSAQDFGLLIGASGQSVYAWELGKSKPRAGSLAAIASLRGVGKREIETRLAALKQTA